jgi:4-aminobutyrate aminotransferase/(S)-3-amino-2-methylpropionate transaminase
VRAYQAEVIIDEIENNHLLDLVQQTGEYLAANLGHLSHKYPEWIQNVRGRGTYMAFDVGSGPKRDLLVTLMRRSGVNVGGSGELSIRLRPMLIFGRKHADVYLDVLESVVQKL